MWDEVGLRTESFPWTKSKSHQVTKRTKKCTVFLRISLDPQNSQQPQHQKKTANKHILWTTLENNSYRSDVCWSKPGKIPSVHRCWKNASKKVGPKTLRKTRNKSKLQASSYEPELCLERAVWELNIGLPSDLPRNAQGIRQDLILVEGTQPWGLPPSVPRHQENKNSG